MATYNPGLNTGYTNNSSGGEFWHALDFVYDIREIMYYARLIETWLGHDPLTTLYIEDFTGTSSRWMDLNAKDGQWDTSVYGESAPSIFDVIDRCREDGLNRTAYSFSQRTPAYLNCIQARNELQEALGAPICTFGEEETTWNTNPRAPNCIPKTAYWVTDDRVAIWCGPCIVDPECEEGDRAYHHLTQRHGVFQATGWWASSATYLLLMHADPITHRDDSFGVHTTVKYVLYPVTPHPRILDDNNYLTILGAPQIDEAGSAGGEVYNISTTVGGATQDYYMHLWACIYESCPYKDPGGNVQSTFDWPLEGNYGYIWGLP